MDVQLKESLKEKEIMLREIHHRVKNNLQIISSLLKLQSSYIKDPEVVEYFNVSQYRIKSMALIHQQLYRSDSLNKIDFQEYLSTLSKDILSIYFHRGRKIEIDVDSKNIFFGIDTAIPCGLLISELLSNSFKHAFPERKNGKIILKITQHDGDKFNLFYRDDGVGLPRDYNFEHPDSMGMELIQSLVEQLDGTVEIKNESGTEYNINFIELSYKKRM
jgi:two-component sensor histidine kinase